MLSAIIIEDDPMVSALNKQYTESTAQIKVIGQFKDGKAALEFLEKSKGVNLIILDVYMPRMGGLQFLKELRSRGIKADVIMVTAANSTASVEKALHYGVLDYLVKPFEYQRFNEALHRFLQKQNLIGSCARLDQSDVDFLFALSSANERNPAPKGMQRQTLEKIRSYLAQHGSQSHTSEEIAGSVGLSKVTVRHYMNYLLECREVSSGIDYGTGGRPRIVYRTSF